MGDAAYVKPDAAKQEKLVNSITAAATVSHVTDTIHHTRSAQFTFSLTSATPLCALPALRPFPILSLAPLPFLCLHLLPDCALNMWQAALKETNVCGGSCSAAYETILELAMTLMRADSCSPRQPPRPTSLTHTHPVPYPHTHSHHDVPLRLHCICARAAPLKPDASQESSSPLPALRGRFRTQSALSRLSSEPIHPRDPPLLPTHHRLSAPTASPPPPPVAASTSRPNG